MDAEKQSHWWWFHSHNNSKCSPWLESTLSELNEKTKTMLKVIEEDADSFAQRAEMYYKKRPELISMVEDFYRAHRSLAERYDLLRGDRSVRVKSPSSESSSLPKDDYVHLFDSANSVKSFDSFTEVAYSSEDAAESEVDDPELDDGSQVDQHEWEKGNSFPGWASFDELTKLREELDRLREENEIHKAEIKQRDQEKEELVMQLSDNISELRKMREDMEALNVENGFILVKQSSEVALADGEDENFRNDFERLEIPIPEEQVEQTDDWVMKVTEEFEGYEIDVKNLNDQIESLKLQIMKQEELVKQVEGEKLDMVKKLQEAEFELIRFKLETLAENDHIKDVLALKDELLKVEVSEKLEATRKFEEMRYELMKVREELQSKNERLSNELVRKEQQLKHEEEEKTKTMKQFEEVETELMDLREELQRQNREVSDVLAEKDEEKRAVIRQLSMAMDILREDNQLLKKSLAKESPKKQSPSEFQFFKGIQLSKLFNPSSKGRANIVHL